MDEKDLFERYRSALKTVVEDSFGWDEIFQRKRSKDRYEADWFHWIENEGIRIGYVCYCVKGLEIHVSLLIIDEDKRSLGHGRMVMERIHSEARKRNCSVTLSSFRKNSSAIKFYEKVGYVEPFQPMHSNTCSNQNFTVNSKICDQKPLRK